MTSNAGRVVGGISQEFFQRVGMVLEKALELFFHQSRMIKDGGSV